VVIALLSWQPDAILISEHPLHYFKHHYHSSYHVIDIILFE